MKITNTYLKQIIKEEIQDFFNESNSIEEALNLPIDPSIKRMVDNLIDGYPEQIKAHELEYIVNQIGAFLQNEEDEAAEAAADMYDYGDQEDYDGY